ncbi:Ribose-phosphate pyrophosphokinase [uncultured archaeon]|nr:Ribose-phosphate pyrophosphokinase [uncultured archaeon]
MKGKEVVLVQGMNPNPNDSLITIAFAGRTARELGAAKVTGVIPYLGYMRQDFRFHDGECVSSRQMAWALNQSIDKIITFDPHLHRIHDLAEIFTIARKRLSANTAIAEHIKKKFQKKGTVLVGPDIESSQWAKSIADSIGFESAVFSKERLSSHKVKLKVGNGTEWKGKNVIVVDDIISSGHTILETLKELRQRKVKSIHVICVHPIFAENSYTKILRAGAKTIVSCNTITHKSNGIDMSGIIAEELAK